MNCVYAAMVRWIKRRWRVCREKGSAYERRCAAKSRAGVLTDFGWLFYAPTSCCEYSLMSSITDIQRALNQIRKLERAGTADTRAAALALMTSTAADIAREL